MCLIVVINEDTDRKWFLLLCIDIDGLELGKELSLLT